MVAPDVASVVWCAQRSQDHGEIDYLLEQRAGDQRQVSGGATAIAVKLSAIPATTLCRAM